MTKFVNIDQDGLLFDFDKQPVTDFEDVFSLLDSLTLNEFVVRGTYKGQQAIVEPYSFALIIKRVETIKGDKVLGQAQYGYEVELDLNKMFLDHNDRFIIYDLRGIPAILSDEAQDQLFNLADGFTDENITFNAKTFDTPLWMPPSAEMSQSTSWSHRYEEKDIGWDMGHPSPSLVWAVEKLKLPKMRIAVLGCGLGHDAHFLATKGHRVIGFDFSQQAIDGAKQKYPESENLKWECEDVFKMPSHYLKQFDLVIEHTCFCAVDPARRDELVSVWESLLSEEGQVLGVFFTMPKNFGPPFGATELEIADRLHKSFRTSLWVRSRVSHPRRLGKELVVVGRLRKRS